MNSTRMSSNIGAGVGGGGTKHLRLDWHLCRDLLAVSSLNADSGGFISFFTKKGGKPFFASKVRVQSAPTCFCWHPTESLLAVGWESGQLSLVDPTKKSESEYLDLGLERICCLLWDASGSLLVAADQKGEIHSFRFDSAETGNSRLDHLGNAQLKEEKPRDMCAKLMPKHLLHPTSASGGGGGDKRFATNNKNSSSNRDQNSVTGGGGQQKNSKTNDENLTLHELLNQRRRNNQQNWGSIDADDAASGHLESKGNVNKSNSMVSQERLSVFILGTEEGGVYLFEPRGNQLNRIFQADSAIRQLVDMPGRTHVLAITDGMMFYQLAIEGRLANDKIKVKLGAQSRHFQMLSVDARTVAFCYGEREIRVWDLEAEDSAILRLSPERGYDASDEQALMLSYHPKKDSICAVTSKWRLATWRRVRDENTAAGDNGGGSSVPIDQKWRLAAAIALNIPKVIGIAWSHTSTAFALNSGDSVQIFLSQCVEFYVDNEYAVIQVSAQLLTLVKIAEPVETQELQLHSNIRGFFVAGSHLLLWDDAKIQLDQIHCPKDAPIQISNVASFEVQNVLQAAYHLQHVYTLANDQLLIHTLQGTVKRAITFREIEGRPVQMSVKGCWLCVASSLGYLRVYDLNDNAMKLTFRSSNLCSSLGADFGRWATIRVNSTGNRVSFTVQKPDDDRPCERLFVWEAENDSVGFFSFHAGITDQQLYEQESVAKSGTAERRPKTAAIRKIETEQSRYRLPLHLPGNHFWDQNDPRLLVCEAISAGGLSEGPTPSHLLSMFVTAEHGIQMHDLQPKSPKADSLAYVAVPFVYFLRNIEVDEEDDMTVERSISRLIFRRTLREFVGIDPAEGKAVQAMLDFSFFLCIGQMDNAFKAIKFIKSESVWEHMARMCVKTRRIDVARVCLGHMGNARAARAIRRTLETKEAPELQIARLAIELGMLEEATRLFEKSSRWDELNRLLQAQGKWTEAFEIAERQDRIHVRHTHFNYAKHLESVGAIEKAIEHYEKANVHHFEVPRMLYDEPKVLEFYVKKRGEPELFKWWAQFLESSGDLETAKNFYQSAQDYLSVVRILCYNGQVQEASTVVQQTGNRAAAFHLALQYETLGDFGQAVHFFSQAGAFSSAIRLAKEHGMVDRLANLALMAGGAAELVEAADFYKDLPGHADKTVMLYHKAGMVGRALDFAFRTGQFGALDLIAQELNEKSDPSVLARAAQFFSANQQDRTAVQMLVYARRHSEAVQLCLDKNVVITEELDALLTPTKMENLSPAERSRLLDQIARCCLQQGNYHFAAKKFTQAGNKIEAMRALLKSGDTQRVVLFANTARDKQIFRMAGNHLQTLNWKEDAQLMRQIEAFYVKAGALDLLSNFYEACAQVEIDEFHDYEKAAAAYSEALRCLNKKLEQPDPQGKEGEQQQQRYLVERQEQLRQTLDTVRRFLDIKTLYETDPGESMRQLGEFSERAGINDTVRLGDIYAIMIAHNAKRDNYRKAWQLIEHCEQQKQKLRIDIRHFLGRQLLDQICDHVGVSRLKSAENKEAAKGEEGEEEDTGVEFSHALRRRIRAGAEEEED